MSLFRYFALFVTAFAMSCWLQPATCDEPAERFLEALNDRGYYDVALDYLEDMESSPLAPQSLKARLPFEKAQTLIASTARIRDFELMEQRLGEAEKLLSEAESSAQTPAIAAKSQQARGDLLLRRAGHYLKLADNPRLVADEKSAFQMQAREYLRSAFDTYKDARDTLRKLLDSYQLDLRDPESKRRLKELRARYVFVRSRLPLVLEKSADTMQPGDAERTKSLERAAEEYEQLFNNYRQYRETVVTSLDSCMFAARCLYKLEKYGAAISLLQQIFALPDSDFYAKLKRNAMVMAADCWSKLEPYPFDDVIANFESAVSRLTRRDLRDSDWQRIQLELARAYRSKAEQLAAEDGDTGRIKSFNRDAAKLIKAVARMPGDHREQARLLLEQWNLPVEAVSELEKKPVATFAEAKQRATELLSEIEVAQAEVADLQRQLLSADAGQRGSLEQRLQSSRGRLNEIANRCLEVLDKAMGFADAQTPAQELNQIRYSQAACHFSLERFFEAALIGEFLVDRFPSVPFSRQAGGIAVRSCAIMHDRAAAEEKAFERDRLQKIADAVLNIWPGSDQAAVAADKLARLVLSQKMLAPDQLELVREYIAQIPDTSPQRSALLVKLGSKLWFAAQNARSEGTDEFQSLLDASIENLNRGLASYDSGNVTMDVALGSLFLANGHLAGGDHESAIEHLESVPMGPIDLVRQKHASLAGSELHDLFVMETWKTAGRAYLAALEKEPSNSKWMDKAVGIVTAMKSRARESSDPKAAENVVKMYRLIAAQMQNQFELIEDPDQQKRFAENLTRFLNTIQSESNDPNTIIWAGRALLDLGETFSARSMDTEAKPLFDSAIESLERAQKMGISDPRLAADLKRQQAVAQRGLGNYERALAMLVDLLKENPKAWQAQMDAARTLQIWGTKKLKKEPLAKALGGTERFRDPTSKRMTNLVWGWSRLVEILAANPKFRDPYYRSLHAAIETRLEYGLIEDNPKVVAAALKQLNISRGRDKTLGGPAWQPKFEKLEQRIRENLPEAEAAAVGKSGE